MIVFGVEMDNTEAAKNYVRATRDNESFRENLKGRIRTIEKKDSLLALVGLENVFPPVWLLGFVAAGVVFYFKGAWGWYSIPLFFFLSGVLTTRYFWFLFFRRNARRDGYKGKIRLLRMREVVAWAVQ